MKIKYLLTLFVFLVFSNISSAGIIHSVDVIRSAEGQNQVFEKLLFKLNVGEVAPFSPGNIVQYEYSIEDIGRSIFFDSGEEFLQATVFLTNGIDNDLTWFVFAPLGGSGYIGTESEFLFGNEGSRVDLFGETITAFELVINDASFTSPGRNPNRDGIWTDYSYDLTLNIYGVSLPSSYTLFLSVLGVLVLVTRKNRFG